MKKTVTLMLGCFLLGYFPIQTVFAVVKPGTTCSKLNSTTSFAGKTYTCIKSGKKLIWNKGVTIKRVSPRPSASPSATLTPAPIASSSPTPTNSIQPKPTVPTTFDNLVSNYSGVAYGAWKKSKEKIESSPDSGVPFELLLGANTQLNNKTPEIAFTQINKLFASAKLPKKITFLAFSYQDREWAISKMEEIVPETVSAWIKDIACPQADKCVGGGSFFNVTTGTNLIVIGTGVDPNNRNNAYSGTLEAHEYTHGIQQSSSNRIFPSVSLLKSPWPPNWYTEGLANFAQYASIYSDSFEKYLQYKRESSADLYRNPEWTAKNIEEYFQRNLTPEWAAKYPRWRQYDLGSMLVEVLVALKGPDTAMQLFRESLDGGGFDPAFQKLYGLPFETALPIISQAIALQLGN